MNEWLRFNDLTQCVETKDGTSVPVELTDNVTCLADAFYIATLRAKQREEGADMTNLRKAAEQALDVGETTIRLLRAEGIYSALTAELGEVCDALRAALAEPDEVAAAVKVEREACARVCDEIGGRDSDSHAWDAAAAIRARGGDVSDD